MFAAMISSDETVAFLLSKGASPDLMDSLNQTALALAASQSHCSSTINLLAPVTKMGIGNVLGKLALFQAEMTPSVTDLVRRAFSDAMAFKPGSFKEFQNALDYATKCGAAGMVKEMTKPLLTMNILLPSTANLLLKNAVESDNAETVGAILPLVREVSSENTVLALTRGRSDVVKLFGLGEDERSTEVAKKSLKAAIVNRTASIESRLPKSVEFTYES